jgi:hypothetical protein
VEVLGKDGVFRSDGGKLLRLLRKVFENQKIREKE